MELVEEFKKEYCREEEEEVKWQEAEEKRKAFSRELLGRYMAKLLYGWDNKKYDREYWKHMEENWSVIKRQASLGICDGGLFYFFSIFFYYVII